MHLRYKIKKQGCENVAECRFYQNDSVIIMSDGNIRAMRYAKVLIAMWQIRRMILMNEIRTTRKGFALPRFDAIVNSFSRLDNALNITKFWHISPLNLRSPPTLTSIPSKELGFRRCSRNLLLRPHSPALWSTGTTPLIFLQKAGQPGSLLSWKDGAL